MAQLASLSGMLDVAVEDGTLWALSLTVTDDDGTPLDLTAYDVSWALYDDSGLVVDSSSVPLHVSGNTVALRVPASVSAGIGPGVYRHRFGLVDPSGAPQPFVAGNWVVKAVIPE